MEKKDAAKILYEQGCTQKSIAEMLGITTKTICSWVDKGKWDEKRTQSALHRETAEEKVWKIINHNLSILERISSIQEKDLQDQKLTVNELQKLLTPRGDIDALQKLFTTIKAKELEWTVIVKVIRDLMEYAEGVNIEVAKAMVEVCNMYINERRKEL